MSFVPGDYLDMRTSIEKPPETYDDDVIRCNLCDYILAEGETWATHANSVLHIRIARTAGIPTETANRFREQADSIEELDPDETPEPLEPAEPEDFS